MVDYKDYSIKALSQRYTWYPKEREAIILYLGTRPDADKDEFNYLQNEKKYEFAVRHLERKGENLVEFSKNELHKSIEYQKYDFENNKRRLDAILKSMHGNPLSIKAVLYEEAQKTKELFNGLKSELRYALVEIDGFRMACLHQTAMFIDYINKLQSGLMNEINTFHPHVNSGIGPKDEDTPENKDQMLKYGPFPAEQHQVVFALFIHYLQKGGVIENFSQGEKGKRMEEIADMYKRTYNTFNQQYLKIDKNRFRLSKINQKNIEAVIPLLDNYPKAKEFAVKDLKKIKNL